MILPQLEQGAAYDRLVFIDTDFSGQHFADRSWEIKESLVVSTFNCPSSPLESVRTYSVPSSTQSIGAPASSKMQVSDYVGISGGVYLPNTTTQPTPNIAAYGIRNHSGVIGQWNTAGQPVRIGSISDGTSNTLAIGEHSDSAVEPSGAKRDIRPSRHASCGPWGNGPGDHATNGWTQMITTIRYPTNAVGIPAGATNPYDSNNGLRSAHTGGVQVLLADGSVRFLSDSINFDTLMALSQKADGVPVGEF